MGDLIEHCPTLPEYRVSYKRNWAGRRRSKVYRRHCEAITLIVKLTDSDNQRRYGSITELIVESRTATAWGDRHDMTDLARRMVTR